MKTKRHMTDANNVEHDARASKRKRLDNDNTNRNWEIQAKSYIFSRYWLYLVNYIAK